MDELLKKLQYYSMSVLGFNLRQIDPNKIKERNECLLSLSDEEIIEFMNWVKKPVKKQNVVSWDNKNELHDIQSTATEILADFYTFLPKREIYKHFLTLLDSKKSWELGMRALDTLCDIRVVPYLKNQLQHKDKEKVKEVISTLDSLPCEGSLIFLQELKAMWEKDDSIVSDIKDAIESVKNDMEAIKEFPSYWHWLWNEIRVEDYERDFD